MTEIIDSIFVSAESFTEAGRRDRSPEDCFRYCREVSVYADRLVQFGFAEHEVPKPLLHVHRATELVVRTEPMDDLEDFLSEIKWSKAVMEQTIEALTAIGADDHAGFLATVHAHLAGLGYDIKRSRLGSIREVIAAAAEQHLSADALERRYGSFGVADDGDDLDRRWRSICLQATNYMDGWTNVKRIAGGPWNEAELGAYFASRLELARRLAGESGSPQPNVVSITDTKAFVLAAREGDIETVRAGLAAGADIDAPMTGGPDWLTDGATALMAAAAKARRDVLALLLAAGADVNARRTTDRATALLLAAQEGQLEIVNDLLNWKSKGKVKTKVNLKAAGGHTALMAATRGLHLEIVRALIAAGADVNAQSRESGTALSLACSRDIDQATIRGGAIDQSCHVAIARLLLGAGADPNVQNSSGWTPLIQASRDGLSDIIQDLLDAGADVNARTDYGDTALSLALSWNRPETARRLLAAGADVHAATEDGETALIAAAESGLRDLVQRLIGAGVDVNASGLHGFSALGRAAAGGHIEVVKILLAAGANVDDRTEYGRTALSLAAMNGHLDAVQMLVAANAILDIKDAEGLTALTIAEREGHDAVVRFLQSCRPSETTAAS
jgi:ankyrin repeat protein